MSACEKCGADSFTEAADFHDPQNSAALCVKHGRDWLAHVVAFTDADLRVFVGTATPEQVAADDQARAAYAHEAARQAASAAKVQQAELEATANAARTGRRKRTLGGAEEVRRTNAAKSDARTRATTAAVAERAETVARLVAERPRTVVEVAAALGVSQRTATRAIADAKRRGLIAERSQYV